jgi:hypothetical protein
LGVLHEGELAGTVNGDKEVEFAFPDFDLSREYSGFGIQRTSWQVGN